MASTDDLGMHGEDEGALAESIVQIVKVPHPDFIDLGRSSKSGINSVTGPHVFKDWEIIETPGKRQFNQRSGTAPLKWPIARGLIADAAVIRREIMSHQAAVIKKIPLKQAVQNIRAKSCRRRPIAYRAPACNSFKNCRRTVEGAAFIFGTFRPRVKIAVMSDFVASLRNLLHSSRKCVSGMPGNEPGRSHAPISE